MCRRGEGIVAGAVREQERGRGSGAIAGRRGLLGRDLRAAAEANVDLEFSATKYACKLDVAVRRARKKDESYLRRAGMSSPPKPICCCTRPVFFPVYAALVVAVFAIGHLILGWKNDLIWFHLIVGAAYAFHVTLTWHVSKTRQSDITSQGSLFSPVIIFLATPTCCCLACRY